jgi:DNA (cytosine-5)-methyltransferase 1
MYRPSLLLLENVRGHLSLGFDVVLAELDRIGYDVRWTLLRAADVGAPHGRSRLWIAARAREVGGWSTPAGEPSALAEEGEWTDPASGLFGSIPARRPGTAGVMVDGLRWDGDAATVNAGTLLPTPRTTDTNGAGAHGDGGLDLRTAVSLLPTPMARDHKGDGQVGSESHAEALRRGQLEAAVSVLLPTPAATDAKGARNSTSGRKADSEHHTGDTLGDLVFDGRLLPTPRATDGSKGGPNQSGSSGDLMLPSAVQPSRWGVYAAAIARWEALTRPAPPPTEQGRNGPRLSPAFVEWMQGLPDGWVVDVPGITRNHALKMLGNGVVSQCAAAAYALLGVSPDLLAQEVAA